MTAQAAPTYCPVRDFATGAQCRRLEGHEPFHRTASGVGFGIGYTDAEAAEWLRDSAKRDQAARRRRP